jgi:hypothetical protein
MNVTCKNPDLEGSERERHYDAARFIDEDRWHELLKTKLCRMILRDEELPSLQTFEALIFKSREFSKIPRQSRSRLRQAIKTAHRQYRDLEIAGAYNAEMSEKGRDVLTNLVNRKYVDGTF